MDALLETLPAPKTAESSALTDLSMPRIRIADYLELTKPRIAVLVLVTTVVGFLLASQGSPITLSGLLHALLGTAFAAAGANALNQYAERIPDARMHRTASRPIPSGRMIPTDALAFGLLVAVAGVAYLALFVNVLSAAVAGVSLLSYVLIYTPLKRRTPWCTVIGAVPGALPPMIGWASARNRLDLGAWLLFAIMFVWQIPHFWSIAWLYRQDYRAGGFPMLPVIDVDGRRTGRQVLWLSALLVLLSAAPWWFGMAGGRYLAGAMGLGIMFWLFGARFAYHKSRTTARWLMLGSIIYLPLLLGLMVADA